MKMCRQKGWISIAVLLTIILTVKALEVPDVESLLKLQSSEKSGEGKERREALELSSCDYERGDFRKIVLSATNAMDFFERHVDGLVLDASIGTRIMESQLLLIRAGHPRLPQAVQMYLMTLQFKSELLSEEILDKFSSILQGNGLTEREILSLERQLAWVKNASLWETPALNEWKSPHSLSAGGAITTALDRSKEIMNEDTSDTCISNLFSSCAITTECAELFTARPHSMYSLTHQVIFFLIARKRECFSKREFKSKLATGNGDQFLHLLCQRVWTEANEIESTGYPNKFRDLLAEQISVCSLAGYQQFLKRSWLQKILAWQSPDENLGCFIDYLTQPDAPADKENTEMESSRLNSKVTKTAFSLYRRRKRADEVLKFGETKCSVHFTAVSLSALAMHLRFFADTCLRSH